MPCKDVLAKFLVKEDGATLVEYGIAITLAIAVGTATLGTLAGAINQNLEAAANEMSANIDE